MKNTFPLQSYCFYFKQICLINQMIKHLIQQDMFHGQGKSPNDSKSQEGFQCLDLADSTNYSKIPRQDI